MNITLDKQSATDGLIKVKLSESDYQPKVEEKVKDYARKATIKGFRQGKVPSGVIKKMFGKSILVEEVNHLVSHSVSDFIRDQKLRILGDPMPNQEKAITIDWDAQRDFEFEFQIGLVDDFSVELSNKVKVKSHPIEVDQKVINETLEDIRKRFGKVTYPEVSEAGHNLYGEIAQKGEEQKKGSYIAIDKVVKKEQKKFIGLKKDDVLEFEIEKAFDNVEAIAQALNIAEEEATRATGTYHFKVTTISKVEPADINQELFDKVFGKDAVQNETEFLEKIKTTIGENYQRETEHLLEHEIQHYYVDHTKISMPEAFLKSWLKSSSQGEVTDSVLEKEFNAYKDSLKWDLIKNKIAEDKEIKVEGEEVREKAKQFIMDQFGGPAIAAQLGDKLNDIANNYLSGQDGKGENFMKIYNQLRHEKIMKAIKEAITVQEKKVTLEEFKKIAAEHRH
ncbi:MAG: trigger factor [Cyclobacteriaceae bacterium]|nr:trigger factor [Cyclobacteriaceae bacterium]